MLQVHSFNLNLFIYFFCKCMHFEIIGYWAASPGHAYFHSFSVWPVNRLMKIIFGCDMTHISQKQQPLTHLAMEADIQSSHNFSLFHLSIDVHPADSHHLCQLPAGSLPSDDDLFLVAFVVSIAMMCLLNPEPCSPQVYGLRSYLKYQSKVTISSVNFSASAKQSCQASQHESAPYVCW